MIYWPLFKLSVYFLYSFWRSFQGLKWRNRISDYCSWVTVFQWIGKNFTYWFFTFFFFFSFRIGVISLFAVQGNKIGNIFFFFYLLIFYLFSFFSLFSIGKNFIPFVPTTRTVIPFQIPILLMTWPTDTKDMQPWKHGNTHNNFPLTSHHKLY